MMAGELTRCLKNLTQFPVRFLDNFNIFVHINIFGKNNDLYFAKFDKKIGTSCRAMNTAVCTLIIIFKNHFES